MTSLRITFQFDEVVIGQDDWIIRQPGLTLESSNKELTLTEFDDKQKK